ncbi:biotin/lipoyl-binding carrier protein [Haloechinothrix halophila]|uniref:biotin/lipoyl-binding carrier protein n=1 Tax=Haloechinothrix halophila TaxID=1069073 RepID=UPI000421BA44|nr:biotin/lipoyl-binding carrier protein [Haloechinothrix halophila]
MAEEIRAEIVGYVIEVVAAEGQAVRRGDHVVVVESMKMEIPTVVEDPGTVTSLHAAVGDFVNEGDLIAVIE